MEGARVRTLTNLSGGIQGGISNGEPVVFRVAFKPTATIAKPQQTVTVAGENTELAARGRHDPCVLPRAVPMVEAMAALVLCDHAPASARAGLLAAVVSMQHGSPFWQMLLLFAGVVFLLWEIWRGWRAGFSVEAVHLAAIVVSGS